MAKAMRAKRRFCAASFTAATLATIAIAMLASAPAWQVAQAADSQATIHVSVRRVLLRVLVADRRTDRPIRGLTADDFIVRDDGVKRPLTYFAAGSSADRPLTVVLLLDLRVLNHARLGNLARSAPAALHQLSSSDEVSVWTMDQARVSEIQPVTADKTAVAEALGQLAIENPKSPQFGSGPADALDAILASFAHVRLKSDLVVIAFTNDLDAVWQTRAKAIRTGFLSTPGTLDLLIRADRSSKFWHGLASVAAPGGFSPSAPGLHYSFFSYLARETGGQTVQVSDDDFGASMIEMLGNVAASYLLEFRPPSAEVERRFHSVRVVLRKGAIPNSQRVRLYYRRGYYESSAQ